MVVPPWAVGSYGHRRSGRMRSRVVQLVVPDQPHVAVGAGEGAPCRRGGRAARCRRRGTIGGRRCRGTTGTGTRRGRAGARSPSRRSGTAARSPLGGFAEARCATSASSGPPPAPRRGRGDPGAGTCDDRACPCRCPHVVRRGHVLYPIASATGRSLGLVFRQGGMTVLQGSTVTLRPATPADVAALVAIRETPEVRRGGDEPMTSRRRCSTTWRRPS